MKIKRYIVTVVDADKDGNCDGKARILSSNCKTEEEAKAYIRNCMEEFIDDHTDDQGQCEYIVDFDKMSARTEGYECTSEWNYEEQFISLTEGERNG